MPTPENSKCSSENFWQPDARDFFYTCCVLCQNLKNEVTYCLEFLDVNLKCTKHDTGLNIAVY
jgi:hypothetical protein